MICAYRKSELYHHGIFGQHWGKRNGPPYPLDAEDHSAAEKKAGWRRSLDNGGDSKKKKKASAHVYTQTENRKRMYDSDSDENKEAARKQALRLREKGYSYEEINRLMGINKLDFMPKFADWMPASEAYLRRREAIDTGKITIKDASKFKNNFTTSELSDIVSRYGAEKSIDSALKEIKAEKRKAAVERIETIIGLSKTAYNAAAEVDKWINFFDSKVNKDNNQDNNNKNKNNQKEKKN